MRIQVRIPGSLQRWFSGSDTAESKATTIQECIEDLERQFPGMQERLLDENNEVTSVMIFLNGDNILKLEGLETSLKDGDELSIMPLAAGG